MCIKYLANTCTLSRSENLLISVSAKTVGVKRLDGVSISSLAKFCAPDNSNPSCQSLCQALKFTSSSWLQ